MVACTSLLISYEQSDRLINDLRIKGVALTGSVAAQAGQNLKKSTVELGARDAFIVQESVSDKFLAGSSPASTDPMNKITITVDGPYLVQAAVPLAHQHIVTNAQGESIAWRQGQAVATPSQGRYALCRCGRSATKPFCDGAHQRSGFDGTETATRQPYMAQAVHIEGPTLVLDDAKSLCAFARFCDPKGQVWHLVLESDEAAAGLVRQQAGDCPGGRLRAHNRTQAPQDRDALEPKYEPSIGLVQDTAKDVSGPLWVRGGIGVVGADGHAYEMRKRTALCRCGASGNKPFCDGSHVSSGFKDGN